MNNPERISNPSALDIENLSFRYIRRDDFALHNLSFQVQPGEVFLIAGASSCGKTILMRCINGLIPRAWIQVTKYRWYDFAIIAIGIIMLISSILLVNFVHIGGFWVPPVIIPGIPG